MNDFTLAIDAIESIRRDAVTILLGDTVVYLPTGWRYLVCGVDPDGTYQLEALDDAPNVWPWVTADKLHLPGAPMPPRRKKTA